MNKNANLSISGGLFGLTCLFYCVRLQQMTQGRSAYAFVMGEEIMRKDDSQLYSVRAIARSKSFRSLFTVHEQKTGDVYIQLKSGLNAGMNNIDVITEDRYSIHASPKSKDYNVIKKTLTTDNSTVTSAALTNAVKLKTGFTHIFSQLYSNLKHRMYDLPNDGRPLLLLNKFNEREQTVRLSLFVGHPESDFPDSVPEMMITKFRTSLFQFVVCSDVLGFPATMFGRTSDTVTFRPEEFETEDEQAHAYAMMEGRSPAKCIALVRSLHARLFITVLEILRTNTPILEAQQYYSKRMATEVARLKKQDQLNGILVDYRYRSDSFDLDLVT